MFVDYVEIQVAAGDGGAGAEAFRREAMVPRGGPSGGDGGRGGDVRLRADSQLATLLDYRYQQHYRAERGQHGQGKNRTGADGESLVLRVPPGTVVRDVESGRVMGELVRDGEELVVARGGRGGRGNAAFATPTDRAPRRWESGGKGEERRIALELKLIADVGLVGQPNAGKSTLLAALSAARPRIADYPFTTLQPNLGVVQLSGHRSFIMADIPGIIEGAHEGRGLGLRFLRHLERTRTLAYLVPVDAEDPLADYRLLRAELAAHTPELARKPHCLVITKTDLEALDEAQADLLETGEAWGVYAVSAVSGKGVGELAEALWRRVQEARRGETTEEAPAEERWRP